MLYWITVLASNLRKYRIGFTFLAFRNVEKWMKPRLPFFIPLITLGIVSCSYISMLYYSHVNLFAYSILASVVLLFVLLRFSYRLDWF
jgi:hypothetical protein